MEKYGRWCDHTTGIHPFLPLDPYGKGKRPRWYQTGPRFLGGLLLALVRMPFVALCFGLLFALSAAVRWVPVASVRRGLLRLVEGSLCRTILWLLGYFSLPTISPPFSALPDSPDASAQLFVLGAHSSYVDLLLLACYCSPEFYAFAPNVWELPAAEAAVNSASRVAVDLDAGVRAAGLSGRCVAYSTLLAALRSVWSCRLHPVERSEPTHLVLRRAALRKGPVAAFPEGVTSNGRVLLHCLPMFDETPAFSAYVVAAVRYRPTESHASAVFTGAEGSAALHMFRLAMNPSNGVQRIYRQQGSVSSPHWQQQMFTAIANMLRIPRAQIGAAHKHGFLTFYRRTSL